eukprot:scaffold93958_cov57-Phaeocystis_antarctica.AAC.2
MVRCVCPPRQPRLRAPWATGYRLYRAGTWNPRRCSTPCRHAPRTAGSRGPVGSACTGLLHRAPHRRSPSWRPRRDSGASRHCHYPCGTLNRVVGRRALVVVANIAQARVHGGSSVALRRRAGRAREARGAQVLASERIVVRARARRRGSALANVAGWAEITLLLGGEAGAVADIPG